MAKFKEAMREIMRKAWQLVKVYGFTMAEAMRQSWAVYKLKVAMRSGIVKFLYTKLDGTVRTAWGTLKENFIPQAIGTDSRKKNDTVQVYYDTEKSAYRCFKIANFVNIR